ncbi:MAG: YkgJ family cysteine cluster protein [Thermoplasmata archaeon]|nr:MAG: YkgJ family cysteine cluster protein [Thermoplasmata archaeon]
MSFCIQNKCAHCCIEADVPLLNEDIDRITAMGYYDVYFVVNHSGLRIMRKLEGKCIFFQNGECEIYERRPFRCRHYPMTFDGDKNCAAIQESCRFKNLYEVTMSGNQAMIDYIVQLRHEFELRTSHKEQK